MLKTLNANTRGILCLLGALVILTVSDSIIKWLSPSLPLHQITLVRSLVALGVVLVIVQFEGGFITLRTRRPLLHIARGAMLTLANIFFFVGLSAMPHPGSGASRSSSSARRS